MVVLVVLFLVSALLYASVGFGGGSTYNALLVLHGTDYRVLPAIALTCNIIVVAGGTWRFSSAGHLAVRRLLPWIAASVPAAWVGGRVPISETAFVGILGVCLLAAGVRLATERPATEGTFESKPVPLGLSLTIGGLLGFLSGLVGIGGGIFLAPVLYMLRWGRAREIAGACSFFILVNSLAGLLGQVMKLDDLGVLSTLGAYWLLFPSVLIGGQIGSRLGAKGLKATTVKRLTAVLILYVGVRLVIRFVSG